MLQKVVLEWMYILMKELELEPLSTTIVKTGLFVKIPEGYEIQVRPRSGLSAKSKLRIANSPGTIDSDYLGEIGIIIDNISDIYHYSIKKGERIAQLVLKKVEQIEWEEVEKNFLKQRKETQEDLAVQENDEL